MNKPITSHPFVPCEHEFSTTKGLCDAWVSDLPDHPRRCEQPESAHAPEPKAETPLTLKDAECFCALVEERPHYHQHAIVVRGASEPKADRLSEAAEDLRLDLDIPGDEADDARRRIRAALESVVRSCADVAGDGNGNMGRECERQILRAFGLEDHDGR